MGLFIHLSTAILIFAIVSGTSALAATQRVFVGKFQSRCLWTPAGSKNNPAPAIVMIPGSGAQGAEEMMPSALTGDGQNHSLFGEIASPLQQAGINTLQVGKPGIEFFSSWDMTKFFYDMNLYSGLHWHDLIDNLSEAVNFLRQQPNVDPHRIFVLGHSEGTQVAVDYAATNPGIAGVILLGYAGEDLATILDWQLFRRQIDDFVATDVDTDHDGYVTRAEAANWPKDFNWNWQPGQDKVSYAEIEAALRKDPALISAYDKAKNAPIWAGVFDRGPIYNLTASWFSFSGQRRFKYECPPDFRSNDSHNNKKLLRPDFQRLAVAPTCR